MKVEILSSKFSENFDQVHTSCIPDCLGPPSLDEASIISHTNIRHAIDDLSPSSSCGPDNIPPLFLKGAAIGLISPLHVILNYCFLNSVFPMKWRKAKVIPVFKKGNPSNPCNYRPVSITSPFPKVLEKIISKFLISYLSASDQFHANQHGFLPGRSATSNLLHTVDIITNAIEQGLPIDTVFLDFTRAFDKVHHLTLGNHLVNLAIPPIIIRFISTFIRDRSQQVFLGDVTSRESPVVSGVIQGTILSSTLFTIFINMLKDIQLFTDILLFADDVKLLSIGNVNGVDQCQHDLHSIIEWSHFTHLPISESKSAVMHMGKHNTAASYRVGDSPLACVDKIKDLGISYDSSLSFSLHISDIVGRAHVRAYSILRCLGNCDNPAKIRAFNVYVRPLLEYGSAIWNPSLVRDIKIIESVQKRFTKRLRGMYHRTYEQRLHILGIVSLEKRRLINDLCLLYKIVHNTIYVSPDIPLVKLLPPTNTRRNTLQVHIPTVRSKKRFDFFTLRTSRVWNNLPNDTVCAGSLLNFKRSISNLNLNTYLNVYKF